MSKMKNCKHCNEQVAKSAKVCPKCGGKLGMPGWAKILIAIVVIALIAGVAGSGDSSSNSGNSSSNTGNGGGSSTNGEKFTLVEHYKSEESNQFAMYIEGKIKNNRNKEYSYVQVTFTSYDAEGNVIGSCLDNINNLDANGTWKFKAICTENPDQIDHYELKEITGW